MAAAKAKAKDDTQTRTPDAADVLRRCKSFIADSKFRPTDAQSCWIDTCMQAMWLAMVDDKDTERYFVIASPSWCGRTYALAAVVAAMLDANAPLNILLVVENMRKLVQLRDLIRCLCMCAASAKKVSFLVQAEPTRNRAANADIVFVDAFAHDHAFFTKIMMTVIECAKAAVVFVTQKPTKEKLAK